MCAIFREANHLCTVSTLRLPAWTVRAHVSVRTRARACMHACMRACVCVLPRCSVKIDGVEKSDITEYVLTKSAGLRMVGIVA